MICKQYRRLSLENQDNITGLLFIAPYFIGFLLIQAIPFISSFIISFTNLRFVSNLSKVRFTGIKNFIDIFNDSQVLDSLLKSVYYSCLFVPIIMVSGLVMAVLLNKNIVARGTIRTMVFMPYVSNTVAIAVVWSVLLDPRDGIINMALKSLGVANPPLWLFGDKIVIPTIVMVACWQGCGFYIITYLAALQGIPKELYESSRIDGASAWIEFKNITLPLLSPTTFFLSITAFIGSLQNFSIIQVLTKGGPGNSSRVLSMNIVYDAFTSQKLGYAAAQSMILFSIAMLVTLVQWKGQKKWVNYY